MKYETQRNKNSNTNLKWRLNLSKASRERKPLTEEHKKNIRQSCMGINKGRKRPDVIEYNKSRIGIFKHKEVTKKKIKKSCSKTWKDEKLRKRQSLILIERFKDCKLRKRRSELSKGENNSAYVNGMSRFPYPLKFNKDFKSKIRQKYNYTCQLCGMVESELKGFYKKHVPHHINYIPEDLREINFILLCHQCNKDVNWDRNYWFGYFCHLKGIESEILIGDIK